MGSGRSSCKREDRSLLKVTLPHMYFAPTVGGSTHWHNTLANAPPLQWRERRCEAGLQRGS